MGAEPKAENEETTEEIRNINVNDVLSDVEQAQRERVIDSEDDVKQIESSVNQNE
ncbi:MAG: hypothetical protein LUF30_07115 [Lachnospiraceae bacterium]|nr:hypothetical protein [Lachnospiraceae bacterium]